jgi:RNA polymerase sigma-70 factor (family 1)
MIKESVNPEVQTELLTRLKNGDQRAFAEVYDLYRGRIYKYASRLCKSGETAEEIVQEVFVRIWQKRDQINPELYFGAYIKKITLNHVINHLKKVAKDRALRDKLFIYIENIRNSTEDNLYEKELRKVYMEAIDKLPPQRKLAYEMSRNDYLSHEEIGEQLGISKHTVKNHIVEASKFIRTYVSHHASIICFIIAIAEFIDIN